MALPPRPALLTAPPLPDQGIPAWLAEAVGDATGRGVRVGVIDSGWDHALAAPQLRPGIGLVDPDDELALGRSADTQDRHGHGTACTDLLLQRAPGIEVYPIRVFGRRLETSVPTLQAALLWAAEARLDLVNVSLGTHRPDARERLYAACEVARRAGVVVVAAVHNTEGWSYPAAFANVLSVGAAARPHPLDVEYWPGALVECRAMSDGQRARVLGGRLAPTWGTSFAAPNVTVTSAPTA